MIRKISLLLAACLLGSLISAPALLAQDPPCKPDCFDTASDWILPAASHVVTLPGGCKVNVVYTTRLACGTWHDLQILAIDQIAPFDESCVSYAAMNTKDFLAIITQEMLEANPMGFPPIPPKPPAIQNCNTNWRVLQGACWQKSMHYEYEPTLEPLPLWQPCAGELCCLKSYRVCVDPCGKRTMQQTGSETPPHSCPITGSYPCTPVCD